jgi:hypothetical protein
VRPGATALTRVIFDILAEAHHAPAVRSERTLSLLNCISIPIGEGHLSALLDQAPEVTRPVPRVRPLTNVIFDWSIIELLEHVSI